MESNTSQTHKDVQFIQVNLIETEQIDDLEHIIALYSQYLSAILTDSDDIESRRDNLQCAIDDYETEYDVILGVKL